MKSKIAVAVICFVLGCALTSVPARADSDFWLQQIDNKLDDILRAVNHSDVSLGTPQIYRVNTSPTYGHGLSEEGGYGSVSGKVVGFGCTKDDCYVVTQ